jgi:FkbM family methyltransferase
MKEGAYDATLPGAPAAPDGNFMKEINGLLRMIRREPKIIPGEFDLNSLPGLLEKDDPVILDIGCNDGSHTLRFLSLFKHAGVYSFEPDPRAQARFKEKVTDERVRLFEVALAAADGSADFYVSGGYPSEEWEKVMPQGWDMSGSIRKPAEHRKAYPWCTFDQKIEVKTQRLDTWCREAGVDFIDFIWADVQGAEVDLIEGGQTALGQTRYLYTEYSNRELYEGQVRLETILKLLPDFAVATQYENDVLLKNKRYS